MKTSIAFRAWTATRCDHSVSVSAATHWQCCVQQDYPPPPLPTPQAGLQAKHALTHRRADAARQSAFCRAAAATWAAMHAAAVRCQPVGSCVSHCRVLRLLRRLLMLRRRLLHRCRAACGRVDGWSGARRRAALCLRLLLLRLAARVREPDLRRRAANSSVATLFSRKLKKVSDAALAWVHVDHASSAGEVASMPATSKKPVLKSSSNRTDLDLRLGQPDALAERPPHFLRRELHDCNGGTRQQSDEDRSLCSTLEFKPVQL